MKKIILTFIFIVFLAFNNFSNTLSDIKSFDSGFYPRGLAIGDINSDGKNDILVANFGEDTLIGQENDKVPVSSISIFNGVNLSKQDISAGSSPRGLAIGDINGDNISDFVVSNYADGTISVFVQEGKTIKLLKTIPIGKHPVGVAIYENTVAVAVYSENKIVIFKNNLNDKYEIELPGNPTDVTIGKINNQIILVTANYSTGTISIIADDKTGFVKLKDIKVGGGVCKVEIADVTGDKVNDIITCNFYDNTISVIEFKNNNFLEPVNYALKGLRPNGMAVGDINGDGLLDIVTANRDSDSIDILIQKDGKLNLVKSVYITTEENKTYGPVEVAIGDINNDDRNDIAFTHMRTNTLKVIYQEKPAIPEISSITHPDQNTWYTNNSPIMNIKAKDDLTGIAGYYYAIVKEGTLDENHMNFSESGEVKLENLESGIWNFIAMVKDVAGNLSQKAIFKIKITEEMSEKNTYNYPNPCSESTTIRFPLTQKQEVKIIIYDINGKIIWTKTISEADSIIGVNYIVWDLTNDSGIKVANGTYILKVIAKDKVITKKIAVVR